MITQSDLKDNFVYDKLTGHFYHRKNRNILNHGNIAGKLTMNHSGKSYVMLSVGGVNIRAHRAAVLYVEGFNPPSQVDHLDGCGTNNSYANLRLATPESNQQNLRLYSNNTTGFAGVSMNGKGYYTARIQFRGKTYGLGQFELYDNAVIARKLLNCIFGFNENHGSKRPL